MQCDIENILELCQNFRQALEEATQNKAGFRATLGVAQFPNACCDDASMLLAKYLSDNGYPGSKRIRGSLPDGSVQDHIWLEYEDIIIDITSDQFNRDGVEPVIVSRNSEFHAQFRKIDENEIADFSVRLDSAGSKSALSSLTHNYEILKKYLD